VLDSTHRNRRLLPHRPVHLTLFIPDLLPSRGLVSEPEIDGAAPALRRIFSHGSIESFPAVEAEAWLCQAFEVERRADWPVAALTAAVDGYATENGWWLRADPLHLQLHRSGSRTIAAPALTLEAAEATALIEALNTHFAGTGITFLARDPARWYVRQDQSVDLTAPLLSSVAGRQLPQAILSGTASSHWHRILTEAQMVMHDHPVNSNRESRGLPSINSVLFWGGGLKPAVPGRHFTDIWTDDVLATALAVHSGADCTAAPASLALWSGSRPDPQGQHLITLNRMHHSTRYSGPEAWLKTMGLLDESWFAPLWALLGGPLQELVVVATGAEHCLRCTLRPKDRLKFWRRTPNWTGLLPQDP